MAERIARAVVVERALAPFRDTLRLAETVARASGGRRGKLHPATRVFQALRIAVNDELGRLRRGLPAVASTVRSGGRFAVISFHRLEDREVKGFFDDGADDGRFVHVIDATPTRDEVRTNARSRSARLRAVEVKR
jgi:16S rRNA (cytosine1402-N4)-methyltransferase